MPDSDPRPDREKSINESGPPESPQTNNQKTKRPDFVSADGEVEATISSASSSREDQATCSANRAKLLADTEEPLDEPIDPPSTAMLYIAKEKEGASNKFDGNPGRRVEASDEEDHDDPSVKRAQHRITDTSHLLDFPISTRPSASTPIRRHRDQRPLEQQLAGLRIVHEIVSKSEEPAKDNASAQEATPDDKSQAIKVEVDELAGESLDELDDAFYYQMQEIFLIECAQDNAHTESSQANQDIDSGVNMERIPEAPETINPPLPLSWGTVVSAIVAIPREDLFRGRDLSFLNTDRPDRYY